MIVTIIEPIERTESEVFDFLLHQVGLELPFEQFVQYFEAEDLPKVRKMWNEIQETWEYLYRTTSGI